MAVTINEGTQTEIYTVTNAGTDVQVIKLDVGAGTALADFGGTVRDVANIAKGTITRVEGGTFNLGSVVFASQPAVYVEQPTATALQAQVGMLTGTVTTIAAGTQNTLGTVGVVNNIVKGTVTRLETGTLAEVTLVPTVTTVTTVSNLTNGTTRMSVGTLTTGTLQNLVTGTINALAAGTITAGTIDRLNRRAPVVPTSYGTLGTAGGSAFGTISAASGAGTVHIVSGVSMVVMAGTVDAYLGFGTALNGAAVLARGNFAAGAGMAREFNPPIESGTNTEICYELAGAGTVYYTVQYWKTT